MGPSRYRPIKMSGERSQHFGVTLLQPTQKFGTGNETASPGLPPSRPLALTVGKQGSERLRLPHLRPRALGKATSSSADYKMTHRVRFLSPSAGKIPLHPTLPSRLLGPPQDLPITCCASALVRSKCFVCFLPALCESSPQWIQTLIFYHASSWLKMWSYLKTQQLWWEYLAFSYGACTTETHGIKIKNYFWKPHFPSLLMEKLL